MRYVGIDVHQRMSSVCVLDDRGNTEREMVIKGHWGKAVGALQDVPRPFVVCFEASSAYGVIHEACARVAEQVVVAHPGQMRLIFRSKRKNDRVDAFKLAFLLRLGQVPPVYVPGAGVRQWRRLITFRHHLINERTRTKNRLRALLRGLGIEVPSRLWNRRGLAWLGEQELAAPTALERDLLLDELAHQQVRIRRVETHLGAIAAAHPGVALLKTIPGVGVRTAEAVVAWIDQPQRFANSNTIASYFGLVPSQDASAGINRLGHITKQGPAPVRKLLVEAAWQAVRRSPGLRALFLRIQQDDPGKRNKIAIVAVAHHLVRVMLAMLKTGQGYQPQAA